MLENFLDRKAGSGNENFSTTTPTQGGAGSQHGSGIRIKHSSKTTTSIGRDWSCTNRQGGAKEKPSETSCSMKKRMSLLVYGLSGLAACSASRLKLSKDGLPRPYWDPKTLLPRPCVSRSSIPIGGRLREFAHKWMGITQDPFVLGTIQGYLLQFNQKPTLVKPTFNCEFKVPKNQESMMVLEVRSMLSEGIMEIAPRNKGFFTYPFLIPNNNGESHFIMNLKLLNQFNTCTKFKMTTLKQIRETIYPGQ